MLVVLAVGPIAASVETSLGDETGHEAVGDGGDAVISLHLVNFFTQGKNVLIVNTLVIDGIHEFAHQEQSQTA